MIKKCERKFLWKSLCSSDHQWKNEENSHRADIGIFAVSLNIALTSESAMHRKIAIQNTGATMSA